MTQWRNGQISWRNICINRRIGELLQRLCNVRVKNKASSQVVSKHTTHQLWNFGAGMHSLHIKSLAVKCG
jgi:hypothetical protein